MFSLKDLNFHLGLNSKNQLYILSPRQNNRMHMTIVIYHEFFFGIHGLEAESSNLATSSRSVILILVIALIYLYSTLTILFHYFPKR
jgi:hypothetical protein